MGYQTCLEKAGAEIVSSKRSGDWQGTLYFLLRFEGNLELLTISYGSCSRCDSYQAWLNNEINWNRDSPPTDKELAEFGRTYLTFDSRNPQEVLARVKEDSEWDVGSDAVLRWLEDEVMPILEKESCGYGHAPDYGYGKGPR